MGRQESILIVDDDETLLELIRSRFTSEGLSCQTVTSAKTALELLGESPFDILITDIALPDIDGLELTREVKRRNPNMIVIVMTGFSEDFTHDGALDAGASDFIRKPFTPKELLTRLRQVKTQEELFRSKKEIEKRVKELEDFYEMAVGRELRMIELKKEMEGLKAELAKYKK